VYRAQLLSKVDRDDGRFPERRQDLENRGLFDPARRQDLEAQMARRLKLAPDDVIVYCPPKPPGLSGLNHWVATTPSEAATPLDAVSGPFFGIRQKHYELWELWVFTTADTADDDSRIAGDARSMFGFENLIAADRREDALF
jgi:hypothetical protein